MRKKPKAFCYEEQKNSFLGKWKGASAEELKKRKFYLDDLFRKINMHTEKVAWKKALGTLVIYCKILSKLDFSKPATTGFGGILITAAVVALILFQTLTCEREINLYRKAEQNRESVRLKLQCVNELLEHAHN